MKQPLGGVDGGIPPGVVGEGNLLVSVGEVQLAEEFPLRQGSENILNVGEWVGICLGYLVGSEFVISTDVNAAIPLDDRHNGGQPNRKTTLARSLPASEVCPTRLPLCWGVAEVEETAKFAGVFDNFFDALNVSNYTEGVRHRKPF